VGGDVSVNSEALLMTDFVNLKIKPTQSLKCAYKGRVYARVLVDDRICIIIYVYTVFLKNKGGNWKIPKWRVVQKLQNKVRLHHLIYKKLMYSVLFFFGFVVGVYAATVAATPFFYSGMEIALASLRGGCTVNYWCALETRSSVMDIPYIFYFFLLIFWVKFDCIKK
jgi:hypothetical protein